MVTLRLFFPCVFSFFCSFLYCSFCSFNLKGRPYTKCKTKISTFQKPFFKIDISVYRMNCALGYCFLRVFFCFFLHLPYFPSFSRLFPVFSLVSHRTPGYYQTIGLARGSTEYRSISVLRIKSSSTSLLYDCHAFSFVSFPFTPFLFGFLLFLLFLRHRYYNVIRKYSLTSPLLIPDEMI